MAPHGRGGMQVDEAGYQKVLGYWNGPVPTDTRGWVGQAYASYKEVLGVAQKLHEQNSAVSTAKATNRPPPELPDATVRQQLAKKDLKKLAEIKARLGKLDSDLLATRHALKPFDYENSTVVAAMNRREIRSHLRSMDDTGRREAMRKFEYRQAALETLPELSGLSQTQHQALTEETLRLKFGEQMAALDEARAAYETAWLAHETATMAAENEVKQAGGQIEQPPPPKESAPWI